jgi:hypothetical protein
MPSRSAANRSRVGAAYRRVIEPVLIGNLEASAPGVGLDGGPLPALRISLRPTLAAELVRKYATAGVRTLAMHYAARHRVGGRMTKRQRPPTVIW